MEREWEESGWGQQKEGKLHPQAAKGVETQKAVTTQIQSQWADFAERPLAGLILW